MACGRIFEAEALWMMARDGVLQYHDILRASGRSEDETMKIIGARSRDNGRTPMQWTAGESAGFTTGTPWLGVNRNHAVINVEAERELEGEHLLVLCNFRAAEIAMPALHAAGEKLIGNYPGMAAHLRSYEVIALRWVE